MATTLKFEPVKITVTSEDNRNGLWTFRPCYIYPEGKARKGWVHIQEPDLYTRDCTVAEALKLADHLRTYSHTEEPLVCRPFCTPEEAKALEAKPTLDRT